MLPNRLFHRSPSIPYYIIAFSFLALQTAAAERPSFSERIALAKKIEEQSATTEYFRNSMYPVMGPALGSAMRECMSRADASMLKFTVVADVSPEGQLTRIAHEPSTNTAGCLSAAMALFRVPPPPTCDCGDSFPIVIEMTVEP